MSDQPITADGPPPESSDTGRRGVTIGRVVNLSILVIHVAIFITAICVIGIVGNYLVVLSFYKPEDKQTLKNGRCPFYVVESSTSPDTVELSPDGVCVWFISGHLILALSAIAFFVVGIIRVIFAMNIGIVGTVVEVLGTILLLLIAFSVAVSLSVGIAITCDQLQKSHSASCPKTGFPSGTEQCFTNGTRTTEYCWYNDAQAAQGAAWIIHLFLILFLIVSFVRLCIWGKRWKENRRREALESYDRLEETPAPV